MAATTATLPRAAGNGAALVVVVADLLIDLFTALTSKAAPKAAIEKPAKELSFWQLYRLTAGYDSVSPKVAAKLRKALVS